MAGISDIMNYNTANTRAASTQASGTRTQGSTTTAGSNLSMADFYKLMAAQLRYQDADNPMDTSAMMSQMVQAQMIQTMAQMNQISVTTYAASMVGKEVTMGEINADGFTGQQTVGTVTGVSMFEGEPTLFVDGKAYYMSQLLYVGKGPGAADTGKEDEKEKDDPDGAEGAGSGAGAGVNGAGDANGAGETGVNGADGAGGTGDAGTDGSGSADSTGGTNGTDSTEGTNGSNGTGGIDNGPQQPETPGTESGTETESDASGNSI